MNVGIIVNNSISKPVLLLCMLMLDNEGKVYFFENIDLSWTDKEDKITEVQSYICCKIAH